MAALTITAGDVGVVDDTAATRVVQVGEAVTQGEPLRVDTSDNKYYLCNNGTNAESAATAIALTAADADGYVLVAFTSSKIDIGATVAIGTTYVVGPTDGDINPQSDLGTGDWVTVIGHAISTTEILLTFNQLEVQVA